MPLNYFCVKESQDNILSKKKRGSIIINDLNARKLCKYLLSKKKTKKNYSELVKNNSIPGTIQSPSTTSDSSLYINALSNPDTSFFYPPPSCFHCDPLSLNHRTKY